MEVRTSYRFVAPKPKPTRVVVIGRYSEATDELRGTEQLTATLAVEVSRANGSLNPSQVFQALSEGRTVYTNFSYYRMLQSC